MRRSSRTHCRSHASLASTSDSVDTRLPFPSAALDVAHLGVEGRALGLRRRVPLHLLKNQHTIDQPLERRSFRRRRTAAVHQVQRHRPSHVGERDQMAVDDGHHAVDDLGRRGCGSREDQRPAEHA